MSTPTKSKAQIVAESLVIGDTYLISSNMVAASRASRSAAPTQTMIRGSGVAPSRSEWPGTPASYVVVIFFVLFVGV